jgi:hypothetical protein
MASNIKYPENRVLYFIRGDHLGLITTYDSSGDTRTSRKMYQAFDHAVTDGLIVHYYGNPTKVTSVTQTPDIDNLFHSSIVDYVKKCLYMDKAGNEKDAGMAQVSLSLMMQHERKFDTAIKKYGTKKRSKTGGVRAIVPSNFT